MLPISGEPEIGGPRPGMTAWVKPKLVRSPRSIPPEQSDQLALDAHAVGRKDSYLISGIGGLKRNRGAPSAETFERCLLLVDQSNHDVASFGTVGLLDESDVAIENAGLDHAVAAHLEREMLPRREHIRGHVDDVAPGLDRFDRRACGNAPHDRHCDGAGALVLRRRAHAAEIALDHARRESA